MYASGRLRRHQRARVNAPTFPPWVCIVLYTHVAGSEHARARPGVAYTRVGGVRLPSVYKRLRASGSAYTHAGCAVYAVGAFTRALAERCVSYT